MALSMESLDESIRCYDQFFSSIIDMIPRDLYKPMTSEEEEDQEAINKRYHKHRKMPLQTDERKALSKKRLKEIYEPKVEEKEEEETELVETDTMIDEPSIDDGLDALRQRLQDRIAAMKGNRSTSERNKKSNKATKQMQKNKPSKAGIGVGAGTESIVDNTSSSADEVAKEVSRGVLDDMMAHGQDEGVDMGDDIVYSGLVDNNQGTIRADSGKSGSKLRRLKKLIEDTDKRKKQINDLKSQGEAGKKQALEVQWTDVLKEASGTKVLANTSKIKKTIKRKEKLKEKSAREWAERTSQVDAAINKKQEKREDNLLKRKRGPDWVTPPGEEEKAAPEKKRGVPIKGGFADKNKNNKGNTGKGGSASDGKKSRAGFEGKKVDFLNKKQKK